MSDSQWQPHVVVAAVVERDNRFLIVEERINGDLRLNQPAGHWEQGETLIQGVVRETLEESAWDIEVTQFLGVYEWQPPALGYPFVRFAFVGKALRHHPELTLDDGIERAVWMSEEELKACRPIHRGPSVLKCIADYRAGRFLPLHAIQHLVDDHP